MKVALNTKNQNKPCSFVLCRWPSSIFNPHKKNAISVRDQWTIYVQSGFNQACNLFLIKIFILLVQASYMSDRRKNHIRVKPVLRGHILEQRKKIYLNLKIFCLMWQLIEIFINYFVINKFSNLYMSSFVILYIYIMKRKLKEWWSST